MSRWDKYRVKEALPDSSSGGNKWERYKVLDASRQREQPLRSAAPASMSWLDRFKQFGKGALSGIAESPMREAAAQLGSGVMEVAPGVIAPVSSSTAEAQIPQKGIRGLQAQRPDRNDPLGNVLYKAGEFGGGAASLPIPMSIGNFAKNIGMGTGVGGVSGGMQEAGVNPLVADIGSTIATPMLMRARPQHLLDAFKKTGEVASKVPLKLMGLSPKRLNVEAARAAQDLGVELPAAALTDSKLTALMDQYVGKTPHFGNVLKDKYANTERQTRGALQGIYDEIGPAKTPEIESQIAKLYDKSAMGLPESAKVKPERTIEALDKIKINSALMSPNEKELSSSLKALKNELNPSLNSEFGQVKLPPQDFDVARLVGTKKSLNSIIKWDLDEGVKNQLRTVQKAILGDIAEYGKTNPEWYADFKSADELFGKVAKREKMERLISNRGINSGTDDLSYNALSKVINTPDKNKIIQKNVSPETFKKIEKLGVIAKTMAIKNKNIPNPSGTAPTTATYSALLYGLYKPAFAVPALAGGHGITKLLTDKKFLDLALKFAENKGKGQRNILNQMALSKRAKEITGLSIVDLQRELGKQQQDEGEK